jgi:hypothetical protein
VILMYRFIELCLKIGLLFLIISFERVVGLPVLFLTVVISLMLVAKSFSKYIVFILSAFMLAIFYYMSFVFSFLLIAIFYSGFVFGHQVIESNLKRFLALLILSIAIIYFESSMTLNFLVALQVIMGLGISSIFLLKFLFMKYGFLGSKLSAKHSFLK